MEKYGFVYIWFDRKHIRYYIGCHWGREDDGYICSSPWMKQAFKHRPQDFKRKIISKVTTNKRDLLDEEYKWLSLIKDEELGKKYYNLTNHPNGHWTTNELNKQSIAEKISLSHKNDPNWGSWSKGKTLSEETKQKIKEANEKQFENEDQREIRRIKSKELWQDPEYRRINTENKKGVKQSDEQIRKRVETIKERHKTHPPKKRGPISDILKTNLSNHFKNMKWITDGIINKRILKDGEIPEGFRYGKVRRI
jgi:hypothetical protein